MISIKSLTLLLLTSSTQIFTAAQENDKDGDGSDEREFILPPLNVQRDTITVAGYSGGSMMAN